MFKNTSQGEIVLDIGCADKWIKTHLPQQVYYIGLDYPATANALYRTQPNIFGEAEKLPFADESIDTIYLLDVLEHLENPLIALREASRTLKQDGKLVMRIPFLYPIHDAPRDFTRFTIYGLQTLSDHCKLEIVKSDHIGTPFETAALLNNIAYTKAAIDLFSKRNPLFIMAIILPIYFLINNIFSFLLSRAAPNTTIMPHTYLLTLRKTKAGIP